MTYKSPLSYLFVFLLGLAVAKWFLFEDPTGTERELKSTGEMIANLGGDQGSRTTERVHGNGLGHLPNLDDFENVDVFAYFAELASKDAEAAFAKLFEIEDRDIRATAAMGLFQKWGESDPVAALNAIEGMPHSDFSQMATEMMVRGWSISDPVSASEYVDEMPVGRHRLHSVLALLGNWTISDPLAALNWANELPALVEKNEALVTVFGKWGRVDPLSALTELDDYLEGPWKSESLVAVLRAWGGQDAASAAAYIEVNAGNGKFDDRLWRRVSESFLREDMDEAIAWLVRLEDDRVQATTAMSVLPQIIRSNPKAAQELISKLPGSITEGAWLQLGNEWASEDLDAATSWAVSIEDPLSRAEAVKGVALKLTESSPESAAKLVASSEFADKDEFLVQLIRDWAIYEPFEAFDFASANLSRDYQDVAASEIASVLSASDPALAAEWLFEFSDGSLRDEMTNEVYENWVRTSMPEAKEYAESIDEYSLRKVAFEACFDQARRYDAKGAFEWLESEGMLGIDDRKLRSAYLTWVDKDPESASDWARRNQGELTFLAP